MSLWDQFLLWGLEHPQQADMLFSLGCGILVVLLFVYYIATRSAGQGDDSDEV